MSWKRNVLKNKCLNQLRSKSNKYPGMPNLGPVNGEVENFHFWYELKPTVLKEKTRLPSLDCILLEKRLNDFADEKRSKPHTVSYNNFYRSMDGVEEFLKPVHLPPITRNQLVSCKKKRRSSAIRKSQDDDQPLQWKLSRRY